MDGDVKVLNNSAMEGSVQCELKKSVADNNLQKFSRAAEPSVAASGKLSIPEFNGHGHEHAGNDLPVKLGALPLQKPADEEDLRVELELRRRQLQRVLGLLGRQGGKCGGKQAAATRALADEHREAVKRLEQELGVASSAASGAERALTGGPAR